MRFLATGAGIRQFLDIGTGLPTTNNVHEVAQAIAPSSRVVYADNDQLVLAHARALLTSSAEGRTAYIQADLRDPQSHDPEGPATGARAYRAAGLPAQLRDSDQFARLAFPGLDLVPPGVVLVSEWRPAGNGPRPTPAEVSWYGGVARIP